MNEENLTRSSNLEEVGPSPTMQLVKKQFNGRYAISSGEFTSEMVRLMISYIYIHFLNKRYLYIVLTPYV